MKMFAIFYSSSYSRGDLESPRELLILFDNLVRFISEFKPECVFSPK